MTTSVTVMSHAVLNVTSGRATVTESPRTGGNVHILSFYFLSRITSDTCVMLAAILYLLRLYKQWHVNMPQDFETQLRKLIYIFQLARIVLVFCIILGPTVGTQLLWAKYFVLDEFAVLVDNNSGTGLVDESHMPSDNIVPWLAILTDDSRFDHLHLQTLNVLVHAAIYVIDAAAILALEQMASGLWRFLFRDVSHGKPYYP